MQIVYRKKEEEEFGRCLNAVINLWPMEKVNHFEVQWSEYDPMSICLRKPEIEVIVWAKYCPPVDPVQLLFTPHTVLSAPSYIKAITSSKGQPRQSSLQGCFMDPLWEALSRHIILEN